MIEELIFYVSVEISVYCILYGGYLLKYRGLDLQEYGLKIPKGKLFFMSLFWPITMLVLFLHIMTWVIGLFLNVWKWVGDEIYHLFFIGKD